MDTKPATRSDLLLLEQKLRWRMDSLEQRIEDPFTRACDRFKWSMTWRYALMLAVSDTTFYFAYKLI